MSTRAEWTAAAEHLEAAAAADDRPEVSAALRYGADACRREARAAGKPWPWDLIARLELRDTPKGRTR